MLALTGRGWGLLITVLVAKKSVKQKFLPSGAGVAGWQRCTCLAVLCHRPSPSAGRQGTASWPQAALQSPVTRPDLRGLCAAIRCHVGRVVTSGKTWNRVRHPRRERAHHFAVACFQLLLLPIPGWERKSPACPHLPPTPQDWLSARNQARSGGLVPPIIFHARTQAHRSRRPTGPKCVPVFARVSSANALGSEDRAPYRRG